MEVAELKAELKRRGLVPKGRKADMVEMLLNDGMLAMLFETNWA